MNLQGACRVGGLVLPRRFLTEQADENSEDESCSDDDSDSANEYAEGLGCADRSACSNRAASQFEFDNHPREEYFEQPRSHRRSRNGMDADLDHGVLPTLKRARAGSAFDVGDEGSLCNVFGQLQQQEEEEAAAAFMTVEDRTAAVKHQLAKVARRCDHRNNKRAIRSGEGEPPTAAGHCGGRHICHNASLANLCAELTRLRGIFVDGVEAKKVEKVLHTIMQLERLSITAASLKASGAGLELNLPFWRHHPSTDVAKRCRALVQRWRLAVRPDLRQQRLCKAGA